MATREDMEGWLAELAGQIGSGVLAGPWSTTGLAARLVRLDVMMKAAPAEVRNSFARLPDEALLDAAEHRRAELECGEWSWTAPTAEDARDPLEAVRPLAVEILATDLALDAVRGLQPPVDPDVEYEVRELGALVVPCRPHRTGARGRDGQGYPRRGLLAHRILPRRVGPWIVRLWGGRDLAAAREPATALTAGAALFSDLAVRVERPADAPRMFRIVEAQSPDDLGQIDRALAGAHDAGCEALVWPELTMPPHRVEAVRRWLAGRLLRADADGRRLGFAVAGSWHHRRGEKVVNQAPVLGPDGRLLLKVDKRVGFHEFGFGSEDLKTGRRVDVLLLDGALVGFGICRDFADDGADNPFGLLDLDWVVVPSMGNARTTEGHVLTAGLAASRFTTGAFVVQQDEPPEVDGPPPRGRRGALGAVVCGATVAGQREEFRVWRVEKGDSGPKS